MGFPSERRGLCGHKAMAEVAFGPDLGPSPESVRLRYRSASDQWPLCEILEQSGPGPLPDLQPPAGACALHPLHGDLRTAL